MTNAVYAGLNPVSVKPIEAQVKELSHDARRWIAQEFHDSIAHTLSSLSLFINYAESANALNRESGTTSNKLVQLTHQLHSDFDYAVAGEKSSVNEQIHRILERLDASINWIAQLPGEELQLSPRAQHELCNIISEGLHNIAKHAKATMVFLSINQKHGFIHITLTDNGCGFENKGVGLACFGLRGMRERAQTLGGKADIQSTVGVGTTIKVRIPETMSESDDALDNAISCQMMIGSLKNQFASELLELEHCINKLSGQDGDMLALQTAKSLVSDITYGVRSLIASLRGCENPVALDFSQLSNAPIN